MVYTGPVDKEPAASAAFIVWRGYGGPEGWQPTECADWEQAVATYLEQRSNGGRVVMTQLVPLLITYPTGDVTVRVMGEVSG